MEVTAVEWLKPGDTVCSKEPACLKRACPPGDSTQGFLCICRGLLCALYAGWWAHCGRRGFPSASPGVSVSKKNPTVRFTCPQPAATFMPYSCFSSQSLHYSDEERLVLRERTSEIFLPADEINFEGRRNRGGGQERVHSTRRECFL